MEHPFLSVIHWLIIVLLILVGLWVEGIIRNPLSFMRRRMLSTLLLEHIRALVRLGLPLTQGLAPCGDRMSDASRSDLIEVENAISRDGLLVGDALALVPRLITPAEAEVLRVSEMTGNLNVGLDLLLRERRRYTTLRNWMYGTFVYAAAVFLVVAALLSLLLKIVVPKYFRMFAELNVSLPPVTDALSNTAPIIANGWMVIGGIVVAAFALAHFRPRRPSVRGEGQRREYLEHVTQLPGWFLPFMRRALLGEFCLELSMLIKAGVPAHRALFVLADGTLNPWLCARIRNAGELCEKGVPLAAALDEAKIDTLAAWFVSAAANPAELSDALGQLAEDYRSRTSFATAVAVRLIPPLIVLCVGAAVAFFAIGMFLPLVKLAMAISS